MLILLDLNKVKSYAMYDMSGKLLLQQKIISNQFEVSFSNLFVWKLFVDFQK